MYALDWRNPVSWYLRKEPKLFSSEISSPEDVVQGHLPDCSFVAVLAAMCLNPPTITRLFTSPNMTITTITESISVKLFWKDKLTVVSVDSLLPCFPFGAPISVTSTSGLWASFVEKAAAKLVGSYEELCNFGCQKHYELLTGHKPNTLHITYPKAPLPQGTRYPDLADRSQIWQAMELSLAEARPVVCGGRFPGTSPGFHLFNDHAFSVIEMQTRDGQKEVRVYNPWGYTCSLETAFDEDTAENLLSRWITLDQVMDEADFVIVW